MLLSSIIFPSMKLQLLDRKQSYAFYKRWTEQQLFREFSCIKSASAPLQKKELGLQERPEQHLSEYLLGCIISSVVGKCAKQILGGKKHDFLFSDFFLLYVLVLSATAFFMKYRIVSNWNSKINKQINLSQTLLKGGKAEMKQLSYTLAWPAALQQVFLWKKDEDLMNWEVKKKHAHVPCSRNKRKELYAAAVLNLMSFPLWYCLHLGFMLAVTEREEVSFIKSLCKSFSTCRCWNLLTHNHTEANHIMYSVYLHEATISCNLLNVWELLFFPFIQPIIGTPQPSSRVPKERYL